MPHPLLKIYGQMDGQLKYALKHEGLKPTCRQGCAHCCHIMTAIHALEGFLLAQRVIRMPNWKDVAQKARDASFKVIELGHDRRVFFEAYVPCPLLDEKKECSVYDARPAVCRFYMVISDPVLCEPSNNDPNLQIVNTSYFEAQAMKLCMEITNGVLILAPIALMLLWSLPKAAKNKEDEAWLRDLCQGLPDPVEWMKQNDEMHSRWSEEDPGKVKEAYSQAFKQVFGR